MSCPTWVLGIKHSPLQGQRVLLTTAERSSASPPVPSLLRQRHTMLRRLALNSVPPLPRSAGITALATASVSSLQPSLLHPLHQHPPISLSFQIFVCLPINQPLSFLQSLACLPFDYVWWALFYIQRIKEETPEWGSGWSLATSSISINV